MIPESWLRAAFSHANTTPEQRAAIAETQKQLHVWPPDGLPGPDTWKATQHHPDGARLAARITNILTGGCAHEEAVPVETIGTGFTGTEVVAWLCPACDTQLPATWKTGCEAGRHPEPLHMTLSDGTRAGRCDACRTSWTEPQKGTR